MYKNKVNRKLGREAGTTLVEVVVAVGIITVVLTTIIYSISSARPMTRASVNKEKAKFHAQEKAAALLSGIRDDSTVQGSGVSTQLNGMLVRSSNSEVTLLCNTYPTFCEKIVAKNKATADEAEVISFIGINDTVPTDYELVGRRAWAISKEDSSRGVWRVTVAVFPATGNVPIDDVIARTIQ